MRLIVKLLLVVGLVGSATSGAANALGEPSATSEVGVNTIASKNVEHVEFLPFEAGTATGAGVVGDYLYVTSWKSFSIYDVSKPAQPRLVSWTPFGFRFENEDVATNGEILLFSEQAPNDALHVYDVRDKQNPTEVAVLPGAGTHTATCLFDCAWSYGSYDLVGPRGPSTGGQIVDLRDPANPKAAGDWSEKLPSANAHDVDEVRPGLVLTASQPIQFIDARRSLERPELLATATNTGRRAHTVRWPNRGSDRFILASFETNGRPRCDHGSHALHGSAAEGALGKAGDFVVFDTKRWRKTQTFVPVDDYQVTNGTYTDGGPPVNALGCSAHWFQQHPSFRNGGLVAIGFYDHGTRFVRVDKRGQIHEAGYFLPPGAETSAAYWVSDRIVYAIDYTRGIDILRYNGTL